MSDVEVVFITDPEEQDAAVEKSKKEVAERLDFVRRSGAKSAEGFYVEGGKPRAIEE